MSSRNPFGICGGGRPPCGGGCRNVLTIPEAAYQAGCSVSLRIAGGAWLANVASRRVPASSARRLAPPDGVIRSPDYASTVAANPPQQQGDLEPPIILAADVPADVVARRVQAAS